MNNCCSLGQIRMPGSSSGASSSLSAWSFCFHSQTLPQPAGISNSLLQAHSIPRQRAHFTDMKYTDWKSHLSDYCSIPPWFTQTPFPKERLFAKESSSPSHPPVSSTNLHPSSTAFVTLCYISFLYISVFVHTMQAGCVAFATWKIPTNPLKHTQVLTSLQTFFSLCRANCSNSTLFTILLQH